MVAQETVDFAADRKIVVESNEILALAGRRDGDPSPADAPARPATISSSRQGSTAIPSWAPRSSPGPDRPDRAATASIDLVRRRYSTCRWACGNRVERTRLPDATSPQADRIDGRHPDRALHLVLSRPSAASNSSLRRSTSRQNSMYSLPGRVKVKRPGAAVQQHHAPDPFRFPAHAGWRPIG